MATPNRGSSGDDRTRKENPIARHGDAEPEPLNLTANVSEDRMYSWGSQAAQYPPKGPPGISYFRGELGDGLHVDCLLYRDESGDLVGILNHYPTDIPPHERAGAQNIWVHPDRRRQGIGSALSAEAFMRWTTVPTDGFPDRDDLRLTPSGAQMMEGLLKKRSIGHVLPAPPDVVYNEWWDAQGMLGWICPRPAVATHIEIDPRVGGTYRIDIDDEGLALSVTGRYLGIERPRGLAFTWHTSWDPSAPESVVTISLEARDEGRRTHMTIRHLRLAPELQEDYNARWVRAAAQLEEHLTGR
jgi:uncharacterized protein YndB with AHSA1/START domain/GNAT superfamily N-acetyltransferase